MDTTWIVEARDLDDSLGTEPVQIDVRAVAPELLATPPSVHFDLEGGQTDSVPVVISNRQPGPLEWYHTYTSAPFISQRSNQDTVWVRFEEPGLAATIWEDTLWIIDSLAVNSPLAVPLSADNGQIPPVPPYLVVSPPVVMWSAPTGQATLDSASVQISASYDTAIAFNVIDYPAWLYIDATSGVVPQTVILRAAYDSIPFGVYEATVFIEAPDASNSPYALPIVFTADVHSGAGGQDESVVSPDLRIRPNPFNDNVLIEWTHAGAEPVTLSYT
jgi:hypothetical protein